MKRVLGAMFVLVSIAGCKGDKKGEVEAPAAAGTSPQEEPAKQKPALPSIGDDPSPVKICARLAAAAAAEGGEGEAKWKELAPDCEKRLADAMSARAEKYAAFADCMRDKETFTAVMNDCKQLEGDPPGPVTPE